MNSLEYLNSALRITSRMSDIRAIGGATNKHVVTTSFHYQNFIATHSINQLAPIFPRSAPGRVAYGIHRCRAVVKGKIFPLPCPIDYCAALHCSGHSVNGIKCLVFNQQGEDIVYTSKLRRGYLIWLLRFWSRRFWPSNRFGNPPTGCTEKCGFCSERLWAATKVN